MLTEHSENAAPMEMALAMSQAVYPPQRLSARGRKVLSEMMAAQAFFLAVPPIWYPSLLKSNHAARSCPLGVSVNTMVTGPENAVSAPE